MPTIIDWDEIDMQKDLEEMKEQLKITLNEIAYRKAFSEIREGILYKELTTLGDI